MWKAAGQIKCAGKDMCADAGKCLDACTNEKDIVHLYYLFGVNKKNTLIASEVVING